MAGQPQENSWTQQGNGYSQGAPGYGSAYEQQGSPEPYPQQGQVYEQPGAYEQQGTYPQGQVYEQEAYQQPPSYEPAYDQTTVYEQSAAPAHYDQSAPSAPGQYDAAGQQAYAQPQQYPGQAQPFEQRALPGAQGQPGQGWEQWRLPQRQDRPPKAPKSAGTGQGFVGSLFDFGFTSFVTPKIIKVLYVLVTIWTILWALAFLRLGFHYGGMAGGLGTLFIVDPILILVSLGVFRVVLEFFMVTFRMQEDLKALRERSAEGAARGGEGDAAGAVSSTAD